MAAFAVAKGLYVGSQASLDQVQELGITHVLSVVNYEVSPPEGVCHWAVQLEDAESANLLAALPGAVTWLERALRQKGSKVLVHCNAGTSRSPSVVLAAIMKAKGLALEQALGVLRAKAPHICPNPGFMAQLELWGEMGCCLDEEHPAYKQFLLDQVAAQWQEEGWVDPASFAELPEDEEQLQKLDRYRCRKCRHLLATQRNIIPTAGVGRRIFRRQPYNHIQQQQQQQQGLDAAEQQGLAAGSGLEQGSVFTEPLAWMADQVVGPVQGKLYCPQCSARLGSFNWAGISNSTGAWMQLNLQQQQQQHATGSLQQDQQQQRPWFRYLVLDCDGVLVDTEAASCEALRRAVLQVTGVDIPHSFPQDFTPVFGMDVAGCIRHYKAALNRDDWGDVAGIAAAVAAAKEGQYQQLTAAGIQALPGAAALIQSAQRLGLPVGVASSGAASKIQRNLSSSGLITLLPDAKFIVSAAEVRAGKPAPDVYLEVLRRMGCEDASRALVVEDAVHGLVAAKAAGAFAVGVTNSLPAELLSQHADLVVASLEQLDLAGLTGQQQQQQHQ
ncbi:hypothetical protein OEZ86_008291 [Tetradesmus obliquus]|nr:hypothetical protein OEZ86_008291 [Tetradesmus obliquus]